MTTDPSRDPARSTSAPPALRLQSVVRRYGDFTAVDGVNLEVRSGEIVGFLGPNGAGKTTTLRVAAGLLTPHAGTVEIAGHSLADEPELAKAALGFVPDRAFLYDRLTGREFLEFVGALYGVPERVVEARAAALLERLPLGDAFDDAIETYSQGMRQKLSAITACLHDPALLLLDEPLNGLDPFAARALKDLLRERAARGGGVLVSTHLLDVVERLCDRAVILHRGRVIAEGALEALRGGRADTTLEDVFLELTREAGEP
jgi:ABC-2 type transport system ATP-binding protein